MAQNLQFPNNPYTSVLDLDPVLAHNLHIFLHLTDQAPVETVCKAALYLLDHVPATRPAVLEYLGTLYKVFSVLYLQCNQSQKNATSADQIPDTTEINKAVDLIEGNLINSIEELPLNFSCQTIEWLVDLLGDVVSETGVKFAESNTGLTLEEIQAFRFPTIIDGLEIWSNQCKTTQSILVLIKKCFSKATEKQHFLKMLDNVLRASQKFSNSFDWVLCYLTSLNPEFLFEKLLAFSFKELSEVGLQSEPQIQLPRINVINFYAQNYSNLARDSILAFLVNLEGEEVFANALSFVLRTASQSAPLLNILANEVLDKTNHENKLAEYLTSQLVLNEKIISNDLFNAIKSMKNSASVYDLMSSLLDWLTSQGYEGNSSPEFLKLKNIMVRFFIQIFLRDC
jgi:hypothetical protein